MSPKTKLQNNTLQNNWVIFIYLTCNIQVSWTKSQNSMTILFLIFIQSTLLYCTLDYQKVVW